MPHRNVALVLAAALLLVPFTGIASADVCSVADPTGTPLNIRKRPSQHAPIIGALNNKTDVSSKMSRGDWVYIVPLNAAGKSGWVWRKFINCWVYDDLPLAWNCDGTIVWYDDKDLGPSTAGKGPDGKPIGNDDLATIWVVNPPRGRFVFKQRSTPHALSTWGAELNGKPCERQHLPIPE
jgi:hypothetical protein